MGDIGEREKEEKEEGEEAEREEDEEEKEEEEVREEEEEDELEEKEEEEEARPAAGNAVEAARLLSEAAHNYVQLISPRKKTRTFVKLSALTIRCDKKKKTGLKNLAKSVLRIFLFF